MAKVMYLNYLRKDTRAPERSIQMPEFILRLQAAKMKVTTGPFGQCTDS